VKNAARRGTASPSTVENVVLLLKAVPRKESLPPPQRGIPGRMTILVSNNSELVIVVSTISGI
jgi:hypothetical protein